MPRYRIKIEGTGIAVITKTGAPIVGFFVTRIVEADGIEAARAAALASVERDWRAGAYAKLGQHPVLDVIEVGEARWLDRLTTNKAYIFHRGR
ncbi:MAG: hypothetical protein IT529_22900 [Burkholderiales bacterium]|nr:hypothetical protein [Burkholderiales bacterium]